MGYRPPGNVQSAPRPGGESGPQAKLLDGYFSQSQVEEEKLPPGGLIIGFEIGLGKFGPSDTISSIQPLYLDDKGKLTKGTRHGKDWSRPARVQAKPGYAVGAMTGRVGGVMDAISVTFMKIAKQGLDPQDCYDSDWIGGDGGDLKPKLDGGGRPAIGIAFRQNQDGVVTGLGLLFAPAGAGPAARVAGKPPAVAPVVVAPPPVVTTPPAPPVVPRADKTLDEGQVRQLSNSSTRRRPRPRTLCGSWPPRGRRRPTRRSPGRSSGTSRTSRAKTPRCGDWRPRP